MYVLARREKHPTILDANCSHRGSLLTMPILLVNTRRRDKQTLDPNIAPWANIAPLLIVKTLCQASWYFGSANSSQQFRGRFMRCLWNLCTMSADASWGVHGVSYKVSADASRMHLTMRNLRITCMASLGKNVHYLWRVPYVPTHRFACMCGCLLLSTYMRVCLTWTLQSVLFPYPGSTWGEARWAENQMVYIWSTVLWPTEIEAKEIHSNRVSVTLCCITSTVVVCTLTLISNIQWNPRNGTTSGSVQSGLIFEVVWFFKLCLYSHSWCGNVWFVWVYHH